MPIPPRIPETVLRNWRAWWPDQVEAAAADARARVAGAVAAWELTDVTPLAGGEVAIVVAARSPRGDVVLKVNPRVRSESEIFATEARALAVWVRAGTAPRVHATRDDGLTLLLERLRPGTTLEATERDPERILAVLGSLGRRVHQPVPDTEFCRLGAGTEAASWRAALAGTREGDELARLLEPAAGDRLLHIDLHCLNALRSGDDWAVIDPKPHLGDPHADVFAFLYGPPLDDLPADRAVARERVRGLATIYARAAALDVDRTLAWLRLRALTTALGSPPGTMPTERLLRVVDAIA